MDIFEINLNNPIDISGFEIIKSEVDNSTDNKYLMIDFGNHEFKSIEALKHFKEKVISIESSLLKFKKIAFIHPPTLKYTSDNPKRFKYFFSKSDARNGLQKETECTQ